MLDEGGNIMSDGRRDHDAINNPLSRNKVVQ